MAGSEVMASDYKCLRLHCPAPRGYLALVDAVPPLSGTNGLFLSCGPARSPHCLLHSTSQNRDIIYHLGWFSIVITAN